MSIKHFFHHLFNPHCEICKDDSICKTCIVYEQQLFQANNEKKLLLDQIVKLTSPKEIVLDTEEKDYKPIAQSVPWRVRQQMLEREDREKNRLLKNFEDRDIVKENEELETEVLKLNEDK